MTQRRGRRRPEQIVTKLREAEAMLAAGKELAEVCQRLGISRRTYYLWRKEYGDMTVCEAKRLWQLEQENRKLKQLLAEAELDKAILKEAAAGNW